jgi:hypothetical protein
VGAGAGTAGAARPDVAGAKWTANTWAGAIKRVEAAIRDEIREDHERHLAFGARWHEISALPQLFLGV